VDRMRLFSIILRTFTIALVFLSVSLFVWLCLFPPKPPPTYVDGMFVEPTPEEWQAYYEAVKNYDRMRSVFLYIGIAFMVLGILKIILMKKESASSNEKS